MFLYEIPVPLLVLCEPKAVNSFSLFLDRAKMEIPSPHPNNNERVFKMACHVT